ncbi:hypothetical protein ZWY2020_010028 [Hordeum vulgare]|nr:hypothetical protein ZWY2020_010028 [Hordeum vulgare]
MEILFPPYTWDPPGGAANLVSGHNEPPTGSGPHPGPQPAQLVDRTRRPRCPSVPSRLSPPPESRPAHFAPPTALLAAPPRPELAGTARTSA